MSFKQNFTLMSLEQTFVVHTNTGKFHSYEKMTFQGFGGNPTV